MSLRETLEVESTNLRKVFSLHVPLDVSSVLTEYQASRAKLDAYGENNPGYAIFDALYADLMRQRAEFSVIARSARKSAKNEMVALREGIAA